MARAAGRESSKPNQNIEQIRKLTGPCGKLKQKKKRCGKPKSFIFFLKRSAIAGRPQPGPLARGGRVFVSEKFPVVLHKAVQSDEGSRVCAFTSHIIC